MNPLFIVLYCFLLTLNMKNLILLFFLGNSCSFIYYSFEEFGASAIEEAWCNYMFFYSIYILYVSYIYIRLHMYIYIYIDSRNPNTC